MWGVVTPEEAEAKINEQRAEITEEPKNLEEQAISLVGRDIFEKLVKGYTEKQWGRDCKDLPSVIIKSKCYIRRHSVPSQNSCLTFLNPIILGRNST